MNAINNKSVVLVSGGNRGMGLATCIALAERGFHVLLGCRDLSAGQQVVAEFEHQNLSLEAVKLDVTSQTDVDVLAGLLREHYRGIDVLVNNAGVFIDAVLGQPASILDADAKLIAQTFEANTIGPIRLTNAVLPIMREAGYGRIINISSGMGQLSDMGGDYPGYRISKTALNAATKIFAVELEGSGIAVNAVSPGWVATDMGGENAERTLEQGIETAIWLATEADISLSGGFYRDKELIDW